ncbi:MAG: nitrous oxide-stimulated promoter family protein [Methanomassiliicoccales archaeon]
MIWSGIMAFSPKLEVDTVNKMIVMYCNNLHFTKHNEMCSNCREIAQYARLRIEKCPFGDQKPVCSQCQVHCYKPSMREEIKTIMRYSGPRMMAHHPMLTIRYLYRKRFKNQKAI